MMASRSLAVYRIEQHQVSLADISFSCTDLQRQPRLYTASKIVTSHEESLLMILASTTTALHGNKVVTSREESLQIIFCNDNHDFTRQQGRDKS
jgi:hypothetical protein